MLDRIANPRPGMLRHCSPIIVLLGGLAGIVHRTTDIEVSFWCGPLANGLAFRGFADVALDLTDATGRSHLAAWLLREHLIYLGGPAMIDLCQRAIRLEDLTPTEIDTLARLGLRVLGRP